MTFLQSIDSWRSNSIAVVGNAPVSTQQSELVDDHDIVVRFNQLPQYHNGQTGERFTHWVNNRTSRPPNWAVKLGRSFKTPVYIVTESPQSPKAKKAATYFASRQFEVFEQTEEIWSPLDGPRERTGFLLLCLLGHLKIESTAFGFSNYSDDDSAGRHDSGREHKLLEKMSTNTVIPTDGG